jgi:hypothetical protein
MREPISADMQRVEQDAREQVHLEMAADIATPLVFGAPIAWAHCLYARTDGLSSAHRVGFPIKDEPYTACGEPIPAPTLWLTLTPRFAHSLGTCRFCLAEIQRRPQQENAA